MDLVVIGAGPGGYVAAIRAAQLGLKVTLVEKDAALGGTCLNVGCIPSKALLESSHLYALARRGLSEHGLKLAEVGLDLPALLKRKDEVVAQLTGGIRLLMKKNKVQVLQGHGELLSAGQVAVRGETGSTEIAARAIVLATGSAAVELRDAPFDGQVVVSSTEALGFAKVPEHLVVIGAGAVGLELGLVWRRLGAKVTVVEMLPQIVPFADRQMARTLERSLKEQGLELRLGVKVSGVKVVGGAATVALEGGKAGPEILACDKVLVAVGRRPFFAGLGLERAGVALDERGRVAVDDSCQTSVPGIWAIGDLVRGPMLAHKAEDEGLAVAERIAGKAGHVNYAVIPSVVYTAPELAQVGKTEEQAKAEGLEYKVGRFFFRANGRAIAAGETEGLVKILADQKTDRILGVHIVGMHASELIAEAVLAMEYQASSEDLARTIHGHPTLSEAVREAALAVDERSIHS